MRGRKKEAEALGNLVVIGQGNMDQARDFDRTHGRGLKALVDTERQTYRVLGFTRGVTSTIGPRSTLASLRATAKGFVNGPIQGDAFQQGGTLVLAAGGRPVFFYASKFAGDHTEAGVVMEKLAQAAEESKAEKPAGRGRKRGG